MATSRHVLIYGPPAAGKLTVATKLAEYYGLKVLDNHASVDPALRLFEFGAKGFEDLVEELRVALLRAASKAGIDVVSTLVFSHGDDEAHVAKLRAATESNGGVVHFVQLRPSDEVLEQRVTAESRAATTKITDAEMLRGLLARWDVTTPINPDDLRIDNSQIPADVVCRQIAEAFGLG